jgi:histidyl-tRNA synthetase
VVTLGPDELLSGVVAVRDMEAGGEQRVALADLAATRRPAS